MLSQIAQFRNITDCLFQLEHQGDGCWAASSKLYFNFNLEEVDENGETVTRRVETKRVHKGLSKNMNPHVCDKNYENAILNWAVSGGTNNGFRLHEGDLCMYQCIRGSIGGFYAKRAVMNDNVSTLPLDR